MVNTKYWIFIFLMAFCFVNQAKSNELSRDATISVLTLGAYQPELYSIFGHSAFRVKDPQKEIDIVFNYGVFDFDQPNFYLNFFKGRPYYRLGMSNYQRFERLYIYQDRSITEQVLNLDSAQSQKLYGFLLDNYKPENRNYVYNYFFDNCATKINEVIKAALGNDQLIFDDSFADQKSIRELMNERMDLHPWGYLAFNLFLADIEAPATPEEYLYLPEYVLLSLRNATFRSGSGGDSGKPLVRDEIKTYESRGLVDYVAPAVTPAICFAFLFFITVLITAWDLKRKKRSRFYDFGLFFLVGFIGVLLVYLWFFTSHVSQNNWNLIWALPTHIGFTFALLRKDTSELISKYFALSGIVCLVFLLCYALIPQGIPWYFMFLWASILLRSWYIYRYRKNAKLSSYSY